MISSRLLISTSLALSFLGVSFFAGVSADDGDQPSTVTPITQFQSPDAGLPGGVSYQKGILGDILTKMFRADNKKIATAFLHPFHLLMSGSNSTRIPVWDGTSGLNYLVPGTLRDNTTSAIVGIGASPVIGQGTLQVLPGTSAGKVSSNEYCDENGASCFDPTAMASGNMGGSGTANYLSKFTASSTLGPSIIYEDGTNVGVGTTSLSQKLTVNGNIALQALGYMYMGAQYLYGDNSSALYFNSNHSTITQLVMRDLEGTQYGRVYGDTNGTQFGLLDGDGQWSYLAVKDTSTSLVINNDVKMMVDTGGTYTKNGRTEIGYSAYNTGDRYAYVDLTGDDTYTDYGTRLIRYNLGPNSESRLEHKGTGPLVIYTAEAAPIRFYTTAAEAARIHANGNISIGNTTSGEKLDVTGNIKTSGDLMAARLCNAAGASCVTLPLDASQVNGTGLAGYVTRFSDADTLTTGVIRDDATNVGIGIAPGTYKLNVSGNIASTTDMRSPIFYDLDNIAYYLNPASTSITNDMRANIFYDQGNTAYYVDPASTSITNDMRANIFYDQGNTAYYVDPASTSITNDMRANILYDQGNTAYYVDPASTSNMNNATITNVKTTCVGNCY